MIIVIFIILFFAGLIFVSIKINNLKYRAKQSLLQGTGFSASELSATTMDALGEGHLQRFLQENPAYTEESIKNLFIQYANSLISKTILNTFDPKLYNQIQNDSKLEKMQNLQFSRVIINYYGKQKLNGIVTYNDGKDETDIIISCDVLSDRLVLSYYAVRKGNVLGF